MRFFQIQNKCLFAETLGYANRKLRIVYKEASWEGHIILWKKEFLWLERLYHINDISMSDKSFCTGVTEV